MEFLTMEQTFIVTWGGAILLGIALGVIVYFIFEHDK